MQQALERAGIKSNLGWSYAMNALEMASLMQKINGEISLNSLSGTDSSQKVILASQEEQQETSPRT